MTAIQVEASKDPIASRLDFEIVERKGLGHPDTICDRVAETVSQRLSQAYLERFGAVLHHNCDKALLVAGEAEHKLGGGRVLTPMRLVLGDRASFGPSAAALDVKGIAAESVEAWFRGNLPHLDPERHLQLQIELREGSESLTGLFDSPSSQMPGANDTSAAVGYAPLSETEKLTLETELYLNGAEFKDLFPETGQDVKVMAVRVGKVLTMTVAMPLLDRFMSSERDYFQTKDSVRDHLQNRLLEQARGLDQIHVVLNRLDRPGKGVAGMYLSVVGTSAESADSGQVGRGNHVNGIISLRRPGGAEAAAGKNAVSHVGKIYNVLAHRLADKIHRHIAGVAEAVVWLCSAIGDPVARPQIAAVQVKPAGRTTPAELRKPIEDLVNSELEATSELCRDLVSGAWPLP